MVRKVRKWLDNEVAEIRSKPIRWLSEEHFFRDPSRPMFSDLNYFFSPADGVILYAKDVDPDENILAIKGLNYSLKTATADAEFAQRSLVIGIFMTFYDVHVNRIPFPGRLSYRELDPIKTFNYPMLDVEKEIVDEGDPLPKAGAYLFNNQRMINRIYSIELQQSYYILQIADYDVDCIMPFTTKQNQRMDQNSRFSLIRYGSQVDLILPHSAIYEFKSCVQPGLHVEAGLDPIVEIVGR